MEKHDRLFLFAGWSICLVGAVLALRLLVGRLLPVVTPFLIGYCIALLMRPLARKLTKGSRFERPLRAILSAVTVAVLLLFVSVLVRSLLGEALAMLSDLVESGAVETLFDGLRSPFASRALPAELRSQAGTAVGELLSSALSALGKAAAGFAAKLPGVLLFLLAAAIAAVWFSLDLEKCHKALFSVLPPKAGEKLRTIRENGLRVAAGYLRAYGLLGLISFSIVFAGLLILRVRYAFLLAVLIALLDALPIIGVGTVVLPWSLYAFLVGRSGFGVGLLVLYAVNLTVRQVTEPKILGKNLGLHPLLTFFLLYAGVSLFGAVGLLTVPVAAILSESLLALLKRGKTETE